MKIKVLYLLLTLIVSISVIAGEMRCNPDCSKVCSTILDYAGGAFAEYSHILKQLKIYRLMYEAKGGTVFAVDSTASPIDWAMQKHFGYAAAVSLQANNGCSPMFVAKYGNDISYLCRPWNCKNTCEAASVFTSAIGSPDSSMDNKPDWLTGSCSQLYRLSSQNDSFLTCKNPESKMLIALYNSKPQEFRADDGSKGCEMFSPMVGVRVNTFPCKNCGFHHHYALNLKHLWPSYWMKTCLRYICCEGAQRRSFNRDFVDIENRRGQKNVAEGVKKDETDPKVFSNLEELEEEYGLKNDTNVPKDPKAISDAHKIKKLAIENKKMMLSGVANMMTEFKTLSWLQILYDGISGSDMRELLGEIL